MNRLLRLQIRLLVRRVGNESGIALASVIAITAVMAVFVTASIAVTVGSVTKSRGDEDLNSALAAAYAGVEEYQSLLANNPAYVRFGNPASKYSNPPGRADLASKLALPTGAPNPAFGLGKAGTWANVAGSEGNGQFRYEVNNSKFDAAGVVTIRSTGRVGEATRTIVADLKQDGFVAYVYFTDFETVDPNSTTSTCNRYAWANPARPSSCTELTFGGGDVIDGDVHSNDRLVVCDVTFQKRVSTEYNPGAGNPAYKKQTGSCAPKFNGGNPFFYGHIEMPATNQLLKKETRSDLKGSDVPNPGCLYTGPTSIVFNSNGTMTVKSPWTKASQVVGEPATAPTDASAQCGSRSLLNSTGATVPVPNNNVIFVQNVPSDTKNPNYSGTPPAAVKCEPYEVIEKGKKVQKPRDNGLGYPTTSEEADAAQYGCRNGDAFVQGTLKGKLTVAAENYLYVTGDQKYQDPAEDLLGLVGQNAVYVWNPIDEDGNCLRSPGANKTNPRTIDAAILSVAHTFTVQNYTKCGYRGVLTVTGSIAQKYRGAVVLFSGTTISNGYKKNYKYDSRLKYTAPPKFLAPLSTTYGVTTWIETPRAFNADGSYLNG